MPNTGTTCFKFSGGISRNDTIKFGVAERADDFLNTVNSGNK
jgi:hypothetical protein